MKVYWPHRSNAKGFSIQKLAFKYPEKSTVLSTDKKSNELLTGRYLKSEIEDNRNLDMSPILKKRGHWANRDFSEYRKVA